MALIKSCLASGAADFVPDNSYRVIANGTNFLSDLLTYTDNTSFVISTNGGQQSLISSVINVKGKNTIELTDNGGMNVGVAAGVKADGTSDILANIGVETDITAYDYVYLALTRSSGYATTTTLIIK